ncbi:hypothetical protein [Pantoea cypripedii]|uniref:Uncharacterized protein n=1 Tax=Pantoea cypripedii TaxID=55209 RepID=A0A6B9FXN0_PANCY|nr:hypothetical protein [Pantoea cypripedii]QGY29364.1 hypothetical protein CUN67_10640 [Pantoea cypripedii]
MPAIPSKSKTNDVITPNFITTVFTPEEEDKIAEMAFKIQNQKPKHKIRDELKLTAEHIAKIRKACILGHSAKSIADAFNVSIPYVLQQKRLYNPRRYLKKPICLVEKSLMAQQMKKEGMSIDLISEHLGLDLRMTRKLLELKNSEYLEQQILPWEVVLRNLRSERYVEDPIWKDDTVKYKLIPLIASGRAEIRQMIGKSKKAWKAKNITSKKEKTFEKEKLFEKEKTFENSKAN